MVWMQFYPPKTFFLARFRFTIAVTPLVTLGTLIIANFWSRKIEIFDVYGVFEGPYFGRPIFQAIWAHSCRNSGQNSEQFLPIPVGISVGGGRLKFGSVGNGRNLGRPNYRGITSKNLKISKISRNFFRDTPP